MVLTSTVPKLGQQGDLLSVQNGFVTNYLVPQGLAKVATKEILAYAPAHLWLPCLLDIGLLPRNHRLGSRVYHMQRRASEDRGGGPEEGRH